MESMKRALLFPGQGSQKVGMGQELAQAFPCAKQVFEEVDDALGERLSQIIWEGPEASLTLTQNAQPALMAVSLAVVEILKQEGGFKIEKQAGFVAGHSLGEYSALASVGVFSLADTARLLRLRGEAMQRAVPEGQGAMAAILGLEVARVAELATAAAQGDICVVANDNAPGQVVVSGDAAAVERAIALAKTEGARRAIPLAVSAPFHCPLMSPAEEEMRAALRDSQANTPTLPVISNVLAQPVVDMARILDLLGEQITAMVRWRESMAYLEGEGIDTLIEIGAGNVLSGLARRCCPDVATLSLGTPSEIEEFLKSL